MTDKSKKDKDVNVFCTASIDGLDQKGNYLEVKAHGSSEGKSIIMFEWWLQSKFASIETIIQGVKKKENAETWIRKMKKINLVEINLLYNEWKVGASLGTVHKIFNGLIANFDAFQNRFKDKDRKENQSEILIMKKRYNSKRILLEEMRGSIIVLNPEFKEKFPEKK